MVLGQNGVYGAVAARRVQEVKRKEVERAPTQLQLMVGGSAWRERAQSLSHVTATLYVLVRNHNYS